MAFFSTPDDPPGEEEGALAYVMWVARDVHGCIDADPESALAQDLGIYGLDVDDFAMKLAERFGSWVADWPWDRFTDLNEGVDVRGCLMLPFMPLVLIYRAVRGMPLFPQDKELERLELGHIASVLEAGQWIDP